MSKSAKLKRKKKVSQLWKKMKRYGKRVKVPGRGKCFTNHEEIEKRISKLQRKNYKIHLLRRK